MDVGEGGDRPAHGQVDGPGRVVELAGARVVGDRLLVDRGGREAAQVDVHVGPDGDGRRADLQTGDLRTALKGSLPDYMLPASFVVIAALPLNASGKVLKFELRARGRELTAS